MVIMFADIKLVWNFGVEPIINRRASLLVYAD